MSIPRTSILSALCAGLVLAPPVLAQQARDARGFPDAPGKDVLVSKCFQCHSPGMWADHRQDRRGWEATLYRMVGRGALWSEDEIRKMADYLGAAYAREPAVFGSEPVKSAAPRREEAQ